MKGDVMMRHGLATLNSNNSKDHKLSKATSSLFPIKVIAVQERTQSNVQQNIEQLQIPTMGVTINKKSTTSETTALERTVA